MAYAHRRWSNVSLMQLAQGISQRPAADPTTDKSRALGAPKNITKDDFFPMIAIVEDDSGLARKTIVVPETQLKLAWDMLGFLLIVYQAVLIPYQIGFDVPSQGAILSFDYFIYVFFVFDILLTFNTAYYQKGALVVRRKLIAKQYFRGWFWIDFFSTFPYEIVIQKLSGDDSVYSENASAKYNTPQMLRLLKLFKFIRISRLLRLAKLKQLMYQLEDFIGQEVIGSLFVFLRLTISGFFVAHWTACIWYLVSAMDSLDRHDTWVKYRKVWVDDGAEVADAYVSALYWSVTTMITIGYGDIFAISYNEKICAIGAMMVSCGVFAYILGNISNVVNKKNELEAVHRTRVISLNSYMKQKDLPQELRFRVRRYLDYIWEHQERNKMEEDEILELLSEPLREEIYANTRGPVFKTYELFANFNPNFPAALCAELVPEVFAPGDSVFDEGEKTNKMYFLLTGTVDVHHKFSSSSFRQLRKSAFFGEIGFFAKKPRTASVRCMEFVNLLSLSRDGIEPVLSRIPDAKESIRAIEERCNENDYTVLKVHCYLCKALGHVATMCNQMVLNRVKEEFRGKWLRARAGHTVLVNPKLPNPNYIRKEKRTNRDLRFHLESVVGVRKDYRFTYRSRSGLVYRISKFLNEKVEQQPIAPSRRVSVNPAPKLRRLSIILNETPGNSDHEDAGDDICRIPSFNMGLMFINSRDDLTPMERRVSHSDVSKGLFPPNSGTQRRGSFAV